MAGITVMQALAAAGSPDTRFEHLPLLVQHRALNLYQDKKWTCCGNTTARHDTTDCFIMTDIPQATLDRLAQPVEFDSLSSEEQRYFLAKHFRPRSGKYRWNCCDSQSATHIGHKASNCKFIRNQSPIPAIQLVSSIDHPLITQAWEFSTACKSSFSQSIRAGLICILTRTINNISNPPPTIVINSDAPVQYRAAQHNVEDPQKEAILRQLFRTKLSGTTFEQWDQNFQQQVLTLYTSGRWYCCHVQGWEHPAICAYLSPVPTTILDQLVPKTPFNELDSVEQAELIKKYQSYHNHKHRWSCCGDQTANHNGDLSKTCRYICNTTAITSYELVNPDEPLIKLCRALCDAYAVEKNKLVKHAMMNMLSRHIHHGS